MKCPNKAYDITHKGQAVSVAVYIDRSVIPCTMKHGANWDCTVIATCVYKDETYEGTAELANVFVAANEDRSLFAKLIGDLIAQSIVELETCIEDHASRMYEEQARIKADKAMMLLTKMRRSARRDLAATVDLTTQVSEPYIG